METYDQYGSLMIRDPSVQPSLARFCFVYNMAGVNPLNTGITAIPMENELLDVYGLHNPADNTKIRLDRVGLWMCGFTATLGSFSTYVDDGDYYANIRLNGTTNYAFGAVQTSAGGAGAIQPAMAAVGPVLCTAPATDYIEGTVNAVDQATTIVGSGVFNVNNLWALYMGPLV